MSKIRARREGDGLFVLYRGDAPIGNILFEHYGKDRSGAALRWMNNFQRQEVHFVGAAERSFFPKMKELVVKYQL